MALARGPVADLLLWMITVRLKRLPTVPAAAMLHQAAPDENERSSFSRGAPLNLDAPAQKLTAYRTIELLHRRLRELFVFFAAADRKSAVHLDRNVWSAERRQHYAV